MWIYLSVGLVALILSAVSFVLGSLHLDFFHHDVGVDMSHDMGVDSSHDVSHGGHEGVSPLKFLNMGGILGGIAGFGFTAAIAMSAFGTGAGAAAGWGILGGLILGVGLGGFWYLLRRSEGTVGQPIESLVGQEATVSERIYSGRLGKVSCIAGNIPVWYTAGSEKEEDIQVGSQVVIKRTSGSTVFVERK